MSTRLPGQGPLPSLTAQVVFFDLKIHVLGVTLQALNCRHSSSHRLLGHMVLLRCPPCAGYQSLSLDSTSTFLILASFAPLCFCLSSSRYAGLRSDQLFDAVLQPIPIAVDTPTLMTPLLGCLMQRLPVQAPLFQLDCPSRTTSRPTTRVDACLLPVGSPTEQHSALSQQHPATPSNTHPPHSLLLLSSSPSTQPTTTVRCLHSGSGLFLHIII